MANKTPFFITGSNCKLKVNGVTMAYATDLSYSVDIAHQSMKVLGLYEADTQEPLAYSIKGNFTLIRYIDSMKDRTTRNQSTCPDGVNDKGNGIGSFSNKGFLGNTIGDFSNEGNAHESLDPSKLSKSTSFDIEIYQKVPGTVSSDIARDIDFLNSRQSGWNRGSNNDVLGVSRIRDCKIIGVVTNINKRGFMTQTFSFVANYLDEDSFLSSSSGIGQQNT